MDYRFDLKDLKYTCEGMENITNGCYIQVLAMLAIAERIEGLIEVNQGIEQSLDVLTRDKF